MMNIDNAMVASLRALVGILRGCGREELFGFVVNLVIIVARYRGNLVCEVLAVMCPNPKTTLISYKCNAYFL